MVLTVLIRLDVFSWSVLVFSICLTAMDCTYASGAMACGTVGPRGMLMSHLERCMYVEALAAIHRQTACRPLKGAGLMSKWLLKTFPDSR